jgi:farnesyl-diphosphate farnesyltransferase
MLEDERLKNQLHISNAMGLMLQKTNITRDYHEDLVQGRCFWPKAIWGNYADNLDWFTHNHTQKSSMACLNNMVLDALQHLPDCILYLRLLKQKSIFRFCAIPQVMAVATLAELFNNPAVFIGVVKIRKPLSAKYMAYTNSIDDAVQFILESLETIETKINVDTALGTRATELISKVKSSIHHPMPHKWETPKTTLVEQAVFF